MPQIVPNCLERKPPAAPNMAIKTKVRMPPMVISVSRRFSRSMPTNAPIRIAMAKFSTAAKVRIDVHEFFRLATRPAAPERRKSGAGHILINHISDPR